MEEEETAAEPQQGQYGAPLQPAPFCGNNNHMADDPDVTVIAIPSCLHHYTARWGTVLANPLLLCSQSVVPRCCSQPHLRPCFQYDNTIVMSVRA